MTTNLALIGFSLLRILVTVVLAEGINFACFLAVMYREETKCLLQSGDYTAYQQWKEIAAEKREQLDRWYVQVPLYLIVILFVDQVFKFWFPFLS